MRAQFGPPVRKEVAFATKLREYKKLGFDGVQFHDDDVVPAEAGAAETERGVAEVRRMVPSLQHDRPFTKPELVPRPLAAD